MTHGHADALAAPSPPARAVADEPALGALRC